MIINGKTIQSNRVPHVISKQAGFGDNRSNSTVNNYKVCKTRTGGYRLYKLVNNLWIDASLRDDKRLAKHAGENP